MTNDTTTLNGALSELGETMADNLVAMGVLDATASDGLTTLAGKILLVEPSISGLDLDTAVTLSASNESISLGSSVVLTSKLTASYDDETLVDVDLNGVLTGATILFKEGSTTIGSGVTDSNGIVTATISNLSAGSHIIKAVFEGTANFNACESSSITVVVSAVDSVTLVSDKNILSYVDGDSAVLTATLTGVGVAGKTVSFDIVDEGVVVENIGTDVTDEYGVASVTYQSNHAGDLNIRAQCGMILSETYSIKDYTKAYSTIFADMSDWATLDYTAPNNFKCSFKAMATSSTNTKVLVGQSASANFMSFGIVTDGTHNGIVTLVGSWGVWTNSVSYTFGTEIDVEFTYNNGVMTFTALGNTITANKTITQRNMFGVLVGNGYLKDLCILEL